MVALRHAPFLWIIPGTPETFMKNSYLAVDLFFVLSGFVLEYAYGQRLCAGMSVRKFMSARFQRLYPLYGLAFLLAVPGLVFKIMTGAVTAHHAILEIVCGSLMLPTPNWGYPHADLYPLNFAAWSLFFELLANLVFALISPYLVNKVLGGIIALTGCAIATLTPLGLLAAEPQTGSLGGGPNWEHFDAGIIRVGFSFFVGVAIYRLHSKTSVRFGSQTAAMIFATTIVALASGFSGSFDAQFDLALVLFLFPLLIFICASVEIDSGKFFQLTKVLGLLSYGIYVLQIPTYSLITYAAKLVGLDRPPVGLLAVIVVIIIAHLATTRVDIPVRRWLKQRLRPKTQLA
jgi:peptidoglycan/LPS O-acetylase OafA/YrhL